MLHMLRWAFALFHRLPRRHSLIATPRMNIDVVCALSLEQPIDIGLHSSLMWSLDHFEFFFPSRYQIFPFDKHHRLHFKDHATFGTNENH